MKIMYTAHIASISSLQSSGLAPTYPFSELYIYTDSLFIGASVVDWLLIFETFSCVLQLAILAECSPYQNRLGPETAYVGHFVVYL